MILSISLVFIVVLASHHANSAALNQTGDGVYFSRNMMMQYTLARKPYPLKERIEIMFSTQTKQGILMQLQNRDNTRYLSIEINNYGGVRLSVQIGWYEKRTFSLNTDPSNDYADNNEHVVKVWRTDNGNVFHLQVDEESIVFSFGSLSSIELDIKSTYIFVGRNFTTRPGSGFEGCIGHMQFDDIFPLKEFLTGLNPEQINLFSGSMSPFPREVLLQHERNCRFPEDPRVGVSDNFRPLSRKTPPVTEVCDTNAEMCFYACSPNLGPWIVKAQEHPDFDRLDKAPICASQCEEWWNACKEEYTCHRDWFADMVWSETNSCKKGSVCRKYKEFYSSAVDFCTTIWHDTYKVVPDSEPCLVFAFDTSKPNPNLAVAQAAAEEKAAA